MEICDYTLAVIIPCWNCEQYIGALLDCLLNQTMTDWKAFLIDDWCEDGTAGIIKAYETKDSRIRYYKRDRDPKSAQTCRNIGFGLAEGAKYVVFFDADDLIAPYCFEQRVLAMDKSNDKDFLSFPSKAFSDSPFDGLRWGFGVKGCKETLLTLLNWRTLSIVVFTNIYKRDSLVDKEIIWDEKLLSMQDADYNIQAFCKGLKHGFAEEARIDYFYRHLQNSVSKQIFNKKQFDSHLYFISKEVDLIQKVYANKYDFFLKSFIVVFFELFERDKRSYRQLLKLPIVRKDLCFASRLLAYYAIGLKGKRHLFKPYCKYNEVSVNEWRMQISSKLCELIPQSMLLCSLI